MEERFMITQNKIAATSLCTQTFTTTRYEDTEAKALLAAKEWLLLGEAFYEKSGIKYKVVSDEETGNYCDKVFTKVIVSELDTKVLIVHISRELK